MPPRIDRREGRRLFGLDPAAYDAARPGHPDRVFELLVERCGLRPGAAVLEIGPGTGQATRRLLELGAGPLVALEPDAALARFLRAAIGDRATILVQALEDAELAPDSFDLAVAASSFHWIDEALGLARIASALRPGGWWAMWWTMFGDDREPDDFMKAIDHLLAGLHESPTAGREGRPRHALDVEARIEALREAGLTDLRHELIPWTFEWDAAGARALYATFSPVARLDEPDRVALLDEIERIARDDFAERVGKTIVTSLYTARKRA